jgi:hypothetical protein
LSQRYFNRSGVGGLIDVSDRERRELTKLDKREAELMSALDEARVEAVAAGQRESAARGVLERAKTAACEKIAADELAAVKARTPPRTRPLDRFLAGLRDRN